MFTELRTTAFQDVREPQRHKQVGADSAVWGKLGSLEGRGEQGRAANAKVCGKINCTRRRGGKVRREPPKRRKQTSTRRRWNYTKWRTKWQELPPTARFLKGHPMARLRRACTLYPHRHPPRGHCLRSRYHQRRRRRRRPALPPRQRRRRAGCREASVGVPAARPSRRPAR